MKKSILIFITLLVSFAAVSCVQEWKLAEDNSSLIKKDSISNFESLDNPILLDFPVSQKFKKGDNECEKTVGSVIAVYDWQTDSFFDYIYCPSYSISSATYGSVFNCVEDGSGKKNYYAVGNDGRVLYFLSGDSGKLSRKEISKTKSTCYSAEVSEVQKKYFLSVTQDSTELFCYNIRLYDCDTGSFGKTIVLNNKKCSADIDDMKVDSEGNFWFCRTAQKDGEPCGEVLKINSAENKIEDTFYSLSCHYGYEDKNYDEYEQYWGFTLLGVSDDYVFLKGFDTGTALDSYEAKLFVISRSDNTIKASLSLNYNDVYTGGLRLIQADGKNYLWIGKYLYLLSGDFSSCEKINGDEPIAESEIADVVVRDSKIYFIRKYYKEICISCFDLGTKKYTSPVDYTSENLK